MDFWGSYTGKQLVCTFLCVGGGRYQLDLSVKAPGFRIDKQHRDTRKLCRARLFGGQDNQIRERAAQPSESIRFAVPTLGTLSDPGAASL